MDNWFEEATWTCPICDYTLHGNEPAVHVICDDCKNEEEGRMSEQSESGGIIDW